MDLAQHLPLAKNGTQPDSKTFSPPIRRRKSYSYDFKRDAVRMALEGTYTIAELGRMLSVNESLLHRWKREIGDDALTRTPTDTPIISGTGMLQHLHEELSRLREERDVLKQAIAILVKSQE